TKGHTGPARPRSLGGLATKVFVQSATARSALRSLSESFLLLLTSSSSSRRKRLVVCSPESALADAAKTLSAAEGASMLRRVGDEDSLDMASLLGANGCLGRERRFHL